MTQEKMGRNQAWVWETQKSAQCFYGCPWVHSKSCCRTRLKSQVALCALDEATADSAKLSSRDDFTIKFILICETSRKYLGRE